VHTGSDNDDSAERMTRKALFSWCHPDGLYLGNSLSSQNVFNNLTIRVSATGVVRRNGSILPSFVLTGTEGTDITVTNATTSTSWTYAIPAGGISNPTLVTDSDGTGTITLDISQDNYLTITATTGAAEEAHIHTVALWEDY
jgi:hypothetical protein